MPSDQLLTAWKPRRDGAYVDTLHSYQLSKALTAEIEALGFERYVAELAAGSVVNHQDEPNFGLLGSHHSDPSRASAALRAIEAWTDAQAVALKQAA